MGCARTALKTIWSDKHFNSLARTLGEYREQLTLRVLLLLNTHYARQDEKLGRLQESNKEIVEVVSINYNSLESTINDLYQYEKASQQKNRADADRRHAETIAAILTTRDDDSRTITGRNYMPDSSSKPSRPGMIQTTTIYKQAVGRTTESDNQLADFETNKFADFTKRVLDALHFRSIRDRHASIPEVHQRTFQWIY
jgi:hypothetical protein